MAYIPLIEYIAESSSQEIFFDKVMKRVEELLPKIDTERKSQNLIKEIVFATQIRYNLHYPKDDFPSLPSTEGALN